MGDIHHIPLMGEFLLQNEKELRIGFFLGVLLIMAFWEVAAPKRRREIPRLLRWTNNIAIVVIDSLLVRLLFPVVAVGLALIAQEKGWGLFNAIDIPLWIAILVSFILFDLLVYAQHVAFHHIPFLWKLHLMHHTDTEIDVSTGLRFHPIEILLSMGLKCIAVVILGAPAVAILIFEVALNATAMFNHSNIKLPQGVDRVLRLITVTPDMHRVHHSVHIHEANSNFGFNLPWWDRLFGTYTAQPKDGHLGMRIGLTIFRDEREIWVDRLLSQPFRSEKKNEKAKNEPGS